MLYKYTVIAASFIGIGVIGMGFIHGAVEVSHKPNLAEDLKTPGVAPDASFSPVARVEAFKDEVLLRVASLTTDPVTDDEVSVEQPVLVTAHARPGVYSVPFYSQFTDISAPEWRKVGCGIASLAMLIEYYEPDSVSVDQLLEEGIEANAYLNDAGWTHAGLITLSHKYGLSGESHDLAGASMESAFSTLTEVLKDGPVMASVHYTFDPQNPIPHLVVVNGVSDGKVYYNDPSESGAGGSVSIVRFQSAWKKRYIDIRPVS